eukprot:10166105-Karenia_brevis.AAC.1
MFRMISRAIYKVKLGWKLEELEYITSSNIGDAGPLIDELPDGEGAWIRYAEELEVLGMLLDPRGNSM